MCAFDGEPVKESDFVEVWIKNVKNRQIVKKKKKTRDRLLLLFAGVSGVFAHGQAYIWMYFSG